MITNPQYLQQSSSASSLKLYKQDDITLTVTPNASNPNYAAGIYQIAHGLNTDKLTWQVAPATGSIGNNLITPFRSNDGRVNFHAYADSTYFYIACAAVSSAAPWSAFDVGFHYRVMVV